MTDAERGDRDLVTLFIKALRELGKAGRAEAAMTLAGQAWWALNDDDPRAAERVNGTMHYLARLMEEPSAAPPAAPPPAATPPAAPPAGE